MNQVSIQLLISNSSAPSQVRMPYGCGEQNMVNFVPTIVVRNYLDVTNRLTSALFAFFAPSLLFSTLDTLAGMRSRSRALGSWRPDISAS